MNPALWAAIIAAQHQHRSTHTGSIESTHKKKLLPLWPRFLLWLIRKRTQRRLLGTTWVKLDDWLWRHYFAAIEKEDCDDR